VTDTAENRSGNGRGQLWYSTAPRYVLSAGDGPGYLMLHRMLHSRSFRPAFCQIRALDGHSGGSGIRSWANLASRDDQPADGQWPQTECLLL